VARAKGLRVTTHVLLVFAVASYFVATFGDGQEIERVEADAARLSAERDSMQRIVNVVNARQRSYQAQVSRAHFAASRLRDSVAVLEQLRRDARLTVRRIDKTADLQARLEAAFPEMGQSRWGVTTIPLDDDDPVGLEYFVVPVWFTETFLIDHQDAASWRAQRHQLAALDSVNQHVIALQDSVHTLEAEKSRAFEAGYHEAYTSYQDLSQRYLAELKKPRFSLGSTLGLCLGAAGAGVLVGSVVNE